MLRPSEKGEEADAVRSNISSTPGKQQAQAPVHINVTQGESRFVPKTSECCEGVISRMTGSFIRQAMSASPKRTGP
jgi:hypothetical protein